MSGQKENKARLAIFGGTFDPPHIAHVKLVSQVQKSFGFSKIFIIPSKYPPGKTPVADFETRVTWTQKVFQAPWAEVLPIERVSSQTIFGFDLYSHLQSENPESRMAWILGEDQWESLSYWKRIDEYAQDLTWVVLPRTHKHADERAAGLLSRRLNHSTCAHYWVRLAPDDSEMDKVSSTDLRNASDTEQVPADDWIPEEIREEVKDYYKMKHSKGGK
jgi:nicotinate-nucleotide adenylyltransferase